MGRCTELRLTLVDKEYLSCQKSFENVIYQEDQPNYFVYYNAIENSEIPLLSLSFLEVPADRRILPENESDMPPRDFNQGKTSWCALIWGVTHYRTKIRDIAMRRNVNIVAYGKTISGLYPYRVFFIDTFYNILFRLWQFYIIA